MLLRLTRKSICALVLTFALGVASVSAQDATSSASQQSQPAAQQPASQDATSAASEQSAAPAAQAQDASSSASAAQDATSSASQGDHAKTSRTKATGLARFDLFGLLRGPLFIAAWVIFALGFAWRIFQFRRMTSRIGPAPITKPVATAQDTEFLTQGMTGVGRFVYQVRRRVKRTVFGTNPVMGVVSLVFHLLLVLVPLLLPAHAILFRLSFHWSLPTLPEPLLDRATLVVLGIGVFFLGRRIFFPRVRALSTVRDYLVLLLVAAPFFTGYAAYHHWLNYRAMLYAHMLIGEVLIALIPFTKLGHMPFLIFSRFFASGEYSWKPGNRRW
ncbi:MAG TPA: hypothetical protein VHE79_01575 [Spirochaetia bacterium]